jgi:hypothetical protein
LLGFLAGTTYLIFDPIRTWFICNKLSSRFTLGTLKGTLYKWWLGIAESNMLSNLFAYGKPAQKEETEAWKERQSEENRLLASVKETPNNLTLLYGPRGSGKSDLIEKVQKDIK